MFFITILIYYSHYWILIADHFLLHMMWHCHETMRLCFAFKTINAVHEQALSDLVYFILCQS